MNLEKRVAFLTKVAVVQLLLLALLGAGLAIGPTRGKLRQQVMALELRLKTLEMRVEADKAVAEEPAPAPRSVSE